MTKTLFLQAVDVWLFRDGRPFDAQSDHRAISLFPPYPSVIQGAIRSHYLVHKGVDLNDRQAIKELVGTSIDYGDLRLRGPYVAEREHGKITRYFPQPADAFTVCKEKHQLRPASLPRPRDEHIRTSAPTPMLLGLDDEPVKGEHNLWIREDDLYTYLGIRDGKTTVTAVISEGLFTRESRLGIGINDKTRTTKESALYEVDFIRPDKDVGLLITLEGYADWPDTGVMRIGGEGHGAYFSTVASEPLPKIPNPLPKHFKLYFATPAYFDYGWRPKDWSKFFEGDVRLVAAALERYQSIGGYDMAKGKHKAARRYVPAGSVYYFETRGEAKLRSGLIQEAITDLGAEIGFGQVIIAGIKEN